MIQNLKLNKDCSLLKDRETDEVVASLCDDHIFCDESDITNSKIGSENNEHSYVLVNVKGGERIISKSAIFL